MMKMEESNVKDIPWHDENGGSEYEGNVMMRVVERYLKDMLWHDENGGRECEGHVMIKMEILHIHFLHFYQ